MNHRVKICEINTYEFSTYSRFESLTFKDKVNAKRCNFVA